MNLSPRLVVFSLLIVSAAMAKPPPPLKQLSECYLLNLKAPGLDAETRKKLEGECGECLKQPKPGEAPEFALRVDGAKASGRCEVKKVAVLPKQMQGPGSGAAFRCAGLFAETSAACQACVNAKGAWVVWPDGKAECSQKPAAATFSKGLECVWAGNELRACSDCVFEKKKWDSVEHECK